MEFNISTFALEIINFLILIWILQRLFYKPLLNVIARRKQFIDQSLADADTIRRQADEQRDLYENRLMLWEQQKQSALSTLHQQLDAERRAQMDRLAADLEQEKQKAKVTLDRRQQEHQQQAEKQALQNGARFAGMLLQQAAGPELEARLVTLLINQLVTLPEACRLCLQTLGGKKSVPVMVSSAYPLTADLQQRLEEKLNSLIDSTIHFQYAQDAGLIAGLSIDIGAWVLNANLKHELAGFAEITDDFE